MKTKKRVAGKWRSWETTEGVIRAPHRSMMRAMGLTDKDIEAPFVGVASTHNEVTPCNSGISPIVNEVKKGIFCINLIWVKNINNKPNREVKKDDFIIALKSDSL